jgi:hypothetical protein
MLPTIPEHSQYFGMILGFVSKGVGILVLPALIVPFVFAAIVENTLFPDSPPGDQLWVLGMALLLSAIILWWLNQYFKQRPRPIIQNPASNEYAKFSRTPAKDPGHFQMRLKRRFQAEHDTGWFMFIPTGFWPFPIGVLGLFMIVGNVVASLTN